MYSFTVGKEEATALFPFITERFMLFDLTFSFKLKDEVYEVIVRGDNTKFIHVQFFMDGWDAARSKGKE